MTTHRNYKDSLGFMLERSRWEGGDNGRGDSVGRTVRAAIIYGGAFVDSIFWSFYGFLSGGPWRPKRHPEEPRTEDFSRDHTVWFVVWLKFFHPELLHRVLKIPWRVSKKFSQTIDMWLWIRALANTRIANLLYWVVAGLYLRFVAWWNDMMYRKYGIYSVDYKDFVAFGNMGSEERWGISVRDRNRCKKWTFPAYSFDIQAFMVWSLSETWFKRRLEKRVIALVEPTNWLVRKLMRDRFTSEEMEEIKNYTGMDGWRWGVRLNAITGVDRYPLEGPQPPYNMDIDALKLP